MSTEQIEKRDEPIREVDQSDIGGSSPEYGSSELIGSSGFLTSERTAVPERIHEAAQEKSLADKIREEHAGEGMVAINRSTGEIFAISDDLRSMREIFNDSDIPPEERLVISCYE